MSQKIWKASAPSNIALIKYMGKSDSRKNIATNGSLSYTLENLRTYCELKKNESSEDQWSLLEGDDLQKIALSEKGRTRYLNFFKLLKEELGIQGNYHISSANNFPSDCGLASSASSFAALTLASYELARDQFGCDFSKEALSALSRRGSGSSCRSFFGPWCEWRGDEIRAYDFPFKNLKHQCVIVEDSVKQVSSSEAHLKVLSSSLFHGRVERAEGRLEKLKQSFNEKNWNELFQTTWAEFWDMHALFETSYPTFGYMTSQSIEVLNFIRSIWLEKGDGPLVTMDAGANVHLLYREDQDSLFQHVKEKLSFKIY